ncbi:MAG: TOBE domain-containing protein [Acidimicrobiia bacterium]|nr:TOBE domain-containing protein [Acidimicrobiia bacterium]
MTTAAGAAPLPPDVAAAAARDGVELAVLGVRPEHLLIGSEGALEATVTVIESLGHERHVICHLADGEMVIVRQAADVTPPAAGSTVRVAAAPEHLHLFDAETGLRVRP